MKRFVTLKILFFFSAISLSLLSNAASVRVEVGNLRYTVDTEAQTAEVSGPVSSSSTITNLVIPDNIEYEGLQIPVISIRNYAFESNKNLKGSLTIGNNVQTIGYSAFIGCSGFTGSLTIGDNVQKIGGAAFCNCSGFTGSLTIPDKVQTIGGSAFQNCSGFTGSLTIPDNVQTIGDDAFFNCSGFTGSLTMGDNVQTIGDDAFFNCTGFTGSLTIPDNVQTIGDDAFCYCTGLTGSLSIGNNVQTIGRDAFLGCYGFSGTLTIGEKVRTIGIAAFRGCSGFTGSLTIGDNVQTIGEWAFCDCSGFTGSLTIGNNVQTIGDYAFSYCTGLTGSLTIPNSVKKIGGDAFYGCSGFNGSLTIGDNVQTIGKEAFTKCSGFTSLYLPTSIVAYDGSVFYSMPLKEITCQAVNPPTIQSTTFSSSTKQTACLYVPSQSVAKYQSANYWKDFNCINNIKVLPTSIIVHPTETTLGIGDIFELEISILPEDAEDADLTFTSSNIKVATVDEDGMVTALSEGKSTITVETENGLTATCEVTVIPVVAESINLSAENLTLLVGQTDKLTATVTPENTTDKTIIWKSDNETIATVSADGTVTAVSVGFANIRATCDEVTATCKVIVYGPDDVTVKPGDGTTPGDDEDTPGNNTENGGSLVGSDLTLRVNQYASIDLEIPEGLSVEPKFAWTLDNGGAEFVSMTVKDNTLSATFKGLKVGNTGYSVSIVGVNGNIEAVKGKITIIAERPMTSLELEPTALTMAQNALPQTINTVYTPDNASMPEFSWTSSVPTVATVDQNGKVTPVGQGQTIITCTALDGSGLSATSTVTVTAPIDEDFGFDESVMGGVEGVTIYIGDTYTLVPKAHDGYQLPENIVWSSSDENTVSVDQNGKVTGLALGSATITASAIVNDKEISTTCKVTVIPIPATSIEIVIHGETTLEINQTVQLTAEVLPENATDKTVVWTSSNAAVADVTETGLVTGLTAGETVITATNSAGQYDRVTITVLSNEPVEPEPVVTTAETPTQLLRKGDGTSHTFIAMMEKDDEVLEAEEYRYVFGYDNLADGTAVIEDTPWRYTHTTEEIYWNTSNDFWVFAYFVDVEGRVHVSSRRHLDGSVDNDFNAADLIGSANKVGEHIIGIYTVDGQFVGKDIEKLDTGIYIVRTSTKSYKIIR